MKVNKIFMALAAMAMVGCSSEDVMDFSANQAVENSDLIQLDANFVLAGVGAEDGITRTHWEMKDKSLVNKFLPIYAAAAIGAKLSDVADLEAQAVGLCWLGNGAVGTDVYTNYQFYHFGWLNNGETEADLNCNELENGSLYSDITPLAAGNADDEADPAVDFVGAIPGKSLKASKDNLNYNSGIYQTKNKAIFGGQYIVYYPFNPDFKDAGTIPAIAETSFSPASTEFTTKELGKATFRYSAPVTIEGGDQAAGFGLKNLSALVQLKVAAPAGDAALGEKIDQIILYSPSKKLLKQANLAADKIVAGKTGADLYASTEGTKTVTATFAAGSEVELKVAKEAAKGAFITVLPTTVDDLVALVHNQTDGTWAAVNMGSTVFEAGSAKVLNITVKDADFTSDYVAVDEASLTTALTAARAVASKEKPQTITIIGDITLETATYDITDAKDAYITIKGDDIIVPEDVTLTVKHATIESDIRVLGKSCCSGTKGGRFNLQGGATIGNVTMEPTEAKVKTPVDYKNYNPALAFATNPNTVAAGKTIDVKAGNVDVIKAVAFKGNINIAKDAKVTVRGTGDLNFMGGTVTNNGTIEVEKAGKFDMTDANGNATATDGQRMTNNGTFIHNVDAGVGTAVQKMNQNGEYRCRVNEQTKLDDAYLQWTACSVIEMVNSAAATYDLKNATQHNSKYVDIEVNAAAVVKTTFTNPDNDGNTINIGNLTANTELDVTFVNNKRTLIVNGDMSVNAKTALTSSKKIDVKGDLTIKGAGVELTYAANNKDGLAVTGDITVSGTNAYFNASENQAVKITCANFTLTDQAKAKFGNRTAGSSTVKTMTVSGTISNPEGCTFDITAATGSNLLAWITCKSLQVGGTFTGARPIVQ